MALRNPHVLKQTVSKNRPQRIIFVDTETKFWEINDEKIKHVLKLGYARFCLYDFQEGYKHYRELEFTDISSFWDWLDKQCKKKSLTYLVSHNMTFDLTILAGFTELPKRDWVIESFYSKGMVSLYRWAKDGRRIIGLDNSNFFSGKLEYWGDLFKIPKLEIDFETANDPELMTYCKRDVEIMVTGWSEWMRFLDKNNCGAFKPTVSSTAFNTWRYRFMKDKIYIHSDPLALEMERESYKGGRTECLYVGDVPGNKFYYLDINSMYGYILATKPFPAGIWGSRDSSTLYELAYKLKRYSVTARVTIDVSDNWFPYKLNNHTCYPLGEFRTTLTTPELKLALKAGWIKEVHGLVWYRQHHLFRDFIDEFRSLRVQYQDEDNQGFEKIVKLIVNGLYGKFGQTGLKQKPIGQCDPDMFMREQVFDEGDQTYYDHIYLGGTIFRENREGESYHSFPAIAAHVTAYARIYLYYFVRQIAPGHVFYMDTDSLIVDQVGFDTLRFYVDPHKMGMLKIELDSPWLHINAPKDYSMQDRIRRKGIRQNAVETQPGVFNQYQWPRLNGVIRAGFSGEYEVQQIEKRRRGVIWSGQVSPSGWVSPFVLAAGLQSTFFPLYQPVEQQKS